MAAYVEQQSEAKAQTGRAPTETIAEAVEARPSPCAFFPGCGGCSFQHLDYAAQLRLKVDVLHESLSRAGVRWDGGIDAGSEIGLYYDPMLAKLIVHAPTREQAIERMHRALLELTIEGVESSRDFHLRLMEDAEFRAGAIEIQWLERRLESIVHAAPPASITRTAALVAALIADEDRRAPPRTASQRTTVDAPNEWLRTARLEGLR